MLLDAANLRHTTQLDNRVDHADCVFRRFHNPVWSGGAAGAAVQLAAEGASNSGEQEAVSTTAYFSRCVFQDNSALSTDPEDISRKDSFCALGTSKSGDRCASILAAQNLAVVSLKQSTFSSNDVMFHCPPVLLAAEHGVTSVGVLQSAGMPAAFSDAATAAKYVFRNGSYASVQAAQRKAPPHLQRLLLSADDAELAEILQVRTRCSWVGQLCKQCSACARSCLQSPSLNCAGQLATDVPSLALMPADITQGRQAALARLEAQPAGDSSSAEAGRRPQRDPLVTGLAVGVTLAIALSALAAVLLARRAGTCRLGAAPGSGQVLQWGLARQTPQQTGPHWAFASAQNGPSLQFTAQASVNGGRVRYIGNSDQSENPARLHQRQLQSITVWSPL
jgi:hypothetical protein